MTVAICWKCGEVKNGGFTTCPKCKAKPQTQEEFALSLALTGWFLSPEKLKQVKAAIAAGRVPTLEAKTGSALRGVLAEFKDLPPLNGANEANKSSSQPPPSTGASD